MATDPKRLKEGIEKAEQFKDALDVWVNAVRTGKDVKRLGLKLANDYSALARERLRLWELAKVAHSASAAPDYDEEAIKGALWDLVDAVLSNGCAT